MERPATAGRAAPAHAPVGRPSHRPIQTPSQARRVTLFAAAALSACTTTPAKPTPYFEGCADPAAPCAYSYDFEPSGLTLDPFRSDPASPEFLVVNEDGGIFGWSVARKDEWDHDNAQLRAFVGQVVTKVESVASATCGGVPVVLLATNFMPGRNGTSPKRERIVALAGSLEAPPRILHKASELVLSIAQREHAKATKVEGLALSPDCRTLYVGLRSVLTTTGADALREEIYPLTLDVDWTGTREEATLGEPLVLQTTATCSGADEGISSLDFAPDGSLLVLTSFEVERQAKKVPTDVVRGDLAGSLWRRTPDGAVKRLACFPGHKPEAVVALPDGKSARVLMEDDEYDGRPIRAYAVKVGL